jgi:hypothetical protein
MSLYNFPICTRSGLPIIAFTKAPAFHCITIEFMAIERPR